MADTVKTLVELHPNYFYKTWYCLPLHNSRQQTTLYSDAARKKHVRRCKFKVKSHRNTSLDLVVPFLKATELDHHHLENNGQCLHWKMLLLSRLSFLGGTQCLKITQNVAFWHFLPIFVLSKLTCLVTLFDRKLQVFKSSPKWTILGIFNQLLSTQNVNVARFARNVEWDFFCDFQTLCLGILQKFRV